MRDESFSAGGLPRIRPSSGEDLSNPSSRFALHAALTARRAEILGKVPFESEGFCSRTEPRPAGSGLTWVYALSIKLSSAVWIGDERFHVAEMPFIRAHG